MRKANALFIPGYTILLCGLMIASSCGPNKKLTNIPGTIDSLVQVDSGLKAADYINTKIVYTTFDGKADLSYKSGNESQQLAVSVKSRYNKETYASIRAGALGITMEAAAALANPDSIIALNRLDRVYYSLSFAESEKLLKAPIDFPALQNLFVGNPLFTEGNITRFHTDSVFAIVEMQKEGFTQVLYYNLRSKNLEKLELNNLARQFSCSIAYSDYKRVSNTIFAFTQDITILLSGKQTLLHLSYTNAAFNTPVEYNFRIPDAYDPGKI